MKRIILVLGAPVLAVVACSPSASVEPVEVVPPPVVEVEPSLEPQPRVQPNCTPGYDPCLPPAPDYDCQGGSGNGPMYTGRVLVTGPDPYDLDRDGNGVGCE